MDDPGRSVCTGVAVDEVADEHVVEENTSLRAVDVGRDGLLGLSEGVGLCAPCSGETASRSPGVEKSGGRGVRG